MSLHALALFSLLVCVVEYETDDFEAVWIPSTGRVYALLPDGSITVSPVSYADSSAAEAALVYALSWEHVDAPVDREECGAVPWLRCLTTATAGYYVRESVGVFAFFSGIAFGFWFVNQSVERVRG